jgi:hypothetical protein
MWAAHDENTTAWAINAAATPTFARCSRVADWSRLCDCVEICHTPQASLLLRVWALPATPMCQLARLIRIDSKHASGRGSVR